MTKQSIPQVLVTNPYTNEQFDLGALFHLVHDNHNDDFLSFLFHHEEAKDTILMLEDTSDSYNGYMRRAFQGSAELVQVLREVVASRKQHSGATLVPVMQ